MFQALLGRKKYEEAMSDEHPQLEILVQRISNFFVQHIFNLHNCFLTAKSHLLQSWRL